jgi:hypothetical protein
MAKIYDLEKEKQKAKEKDKVSTPPIICLRGKGGSRLYPMMEVGPVGEWQIKNPEAVKAMLECDLSELGKEKEPEGS